MKLCRELGLFGTILSFGSLISFCGFQWISHSLMYLLMISSKWWFLHLVFFSLGISLYFGIGSWKSWACILTSCSFLGMLSFFDPIYGGNSTKSQIGWDVHEFHFHIYMHIFMWSLSYVLLVFLTLWSQWVWVPFCLCCCSRNNWRCIGCSAHSQGRCCHHVLFGVKLGWSMTHYLPLTGISYILPMISR